MNINLSNNSWAFKIKRILAQTCFQFITAPLSVMNLMPRLQRTSLGFLYWNSPCSLWSTKHKRSEGKKGSSSARPKRVLYISKTVLVQSPWEPVFSSGRHNNSCIFRTIYHSIRARTCVYDDTWYIGRRYRLRVSESSGGWYTYPARFFTYFSRNVAFVWGKYILHNN